MDGSIALPQRPALPGHRPGSAPATSRLNREDGLLGRRAPGAAAWRAVLQRPFRQPSRGLEWLLAALCLSPLMLMPLARDQGHFAYAGQVILDGGLPYRDVFDQKGPATHYTFALALALFGQTAWGVRFFFYLVALSATRLAAALGERLAGPGARLACALAMALAVLQGDEGAAWHTAQVEDLLLVLQLAAVGLYANQATLSSRCRTLLAAMLLGLSCLYKPTAVVPGGVVLALAGGSLWRTERAARLSGKTWLAYSIGGFLLPPLAALGYLAARGALSDFWMVVVEFNSAYAELKNGLPKGLSMLATRWGRLAVLASCGAVTVRAPGAKTADRLLWGLAFANLATVVWQGKYWPYHWTPLIGCLAIFAGVSAAHVAAELNKRLWLCQSCYERSMRWLGQKLATIDAALGERRRRPAMPRWRHDRGIAAAESYGRECAAPRAALPQPPPRIDNGLVYVSLPSLTAGLASIVLLLVAAPVDLKCLLGTWRDTVRVAAGRQTLAEFRAPYECGAVDAEVHQRAADYIRARTSPHEKLLVWGYETVLNFLSDRRAPTRFAVDRILCLEGFQRQAAWRAEFLASLVQTPPTYIAVVDHNGTGLWRESADELARFSEFHTLLDRDYAEEARFDRLRLFRRRESSTTDRTPREASDGRR